MLSKKGITTAQSEKRTRDRLMDIGKKNETYGEIINKVVDL